MLSYHCDYQCEDDCDAYDDYEYEYECEYEYERDCDDHDYDDDFCSATTTMTTIPTAPALRTGGCVANV